MRIIKRFLPCFCLLIVCLFAFAGVFGLEYVWDDVYLFVDSPELRNPENIFDSISKPILPGTSYFRPFPLLTFIAEFQLSGVNPLLSHAINLAFHLVTTFLITLAVWGILFDTPRRERLLASLIGGALYSLHPAMVEPVAWVAGRFDLMTALFSSAAICSAIFSKGVVRTCLVCAFFLMAALSKEMAAMLPAVIVLVLWVIKRPNEFSYTAVINFSMQHWKLCLALVVTGIIYICIRAVGVEGSIYHSNNVRASYDWVDHLTYIGNTILFYFRMTIWPFSDVNPMHRFPIDFGLKEYLNGALAWGIVLSLLIWNHRTYQRYKSYVLAYMVLLLPVLNVVPLTIGENIGHERFLCAPLLVFALLVSRLVADLLVAKKNWQRLVVGTLGIFIAVCFVNVKVTVPLWANNILLWKWAYDKNSADPYVQFSLISSAVRKGHLNFAQKVVDDIEASGSIADRGKIAVSYLKARKGEYKTALQLAQEGVSYLGEMLPHKALSEEQLASLNYSLGESSRYLESWYIRSAYGVMAESHIALKQFDEAKKDAEIMLFYQPSYPPAHLLYALSLYGLGRKDMGDEAFQGAEAGIVEGSREEVHYIRQQFFSQLCEQEKNNVSCVELKQTLDD